MYNFHMLTKYIIFNLYIHYAYFISEQKKEYQDLNYLINYWNKESCLMLNN